MPWPPKVLVHTAGIKNKPLFPWFLWNHKNSDGGLRPARLNPREGRPTPSRLGRSSLLADGERLACTFFTKFSTLLGSGLFPLPAHLKRIPPVLAKS